MRRTIRSSTIGGLVLFFMVTVVTPAIAAAQITGFSPGSGPVGTVVTINGYGFMGSSAVYLSGDAMPFSVNSDTQITATVAAGASSGKWSVVTPSGKRWSANVFTVTSGGTVTISGFSPGSGPVGTVVTISGNGFNGATAVYLHGVKMPYSVNSNTQITATVAAGATSGLWSVQTPSDRAWSSNSFTVTSGALDITSFSPTSGPVGTVVTIKGSGFTGATVVYLDGKSMPFTVNSNTQITATVAAGATTGKWSVQTPSNRVWSSKTFTVTSGGLAITSFSPTSGPVGTVVTIKGSAFTGVNVVYLDNKSMPFTVNSSTQITATVGAGATTGKWSVQTPSARVWSATQFKVTGGSHARSVSLTLSGHLRASGRVTTVDGYNACSKYVPVVLKRYHHGRWHWVVTVSTSADGAYRAPLRDRPGLYIARAKQVQLVNGATCLADRSAKHRYRG